MTYLLAHVCQNLVMVELFHKGLCDEYDLLSIAMLVALTNSFDFYV